MCKNSINETAEKFSSYLKDKTIEQKEKLLNKQSSDLLDLAYHELVRLSSSINNNEVSKQKILEQALELSSLMIALVDQKED